MIHRIAFGLSLLFVISLIFACVAVKHATEVEIQAYDTGFKYGKEAGFEAGFEAGEMKGLVDRVAGIIRKQEEAHANKLWEVRNEAFGDGLQFEHVHPGRLWVLDRKMPYADD